MASIWAPGRFISWRQKRMKSGGKFWRASARSGMETKYGCWRRVELCISRSPRFTPVHSAGLLAADDRSLASDFTRSIHRIPESHPECGVGSAVGLSVLHVELVAGGVFRSGAGECGAGCAAGCERLLLRAAVD